jgi:hypothetical protein
MIDEWQDLKARPAFRSTGHSKATRKEPFVTLIYRIPILGWLLREAAEGSGNIKALFLVNCALIWLLAIIAFGYPAIIIPALCAVPTIFVLLILITAGR